MGSGFVMKMISIGVPCYNEEDNIQQMYEAITKEMSKMTKYDYEIVFADNDSKDLSQQILRKIASEDDHVKVIINQTNFGPDRSLVNLRKSVNGDAFIGIPCDFQEPPDMIPIFIDEWEKGADIVFGQKNKSKENKIKYMCRGIYYSILNVMSDYPQLSQVDGFGLVDRKVLDIINYTQVQDPEYNARNIVCEYGFDIKLIPYTQNKRERGKSSYNLASYFSFAVNSLCNTSVKPLHLMVVFGVFMGCICLVISLVYFIYKITHWDTFDAGMAPIVIGLFFVSAVQLFCIGMLGEYIAIIIKRITTKPIVVEKERINFKNEKVD